MWKYICIFYISQFWILSLYLAIVFFVSEMQICETKKSQLVFLFAFNCVAKTSLLAKCVFSPHSLEYQI